MTPFFSNLLAILGKISTNIASLFGEITFAG
jgi:hypothetical protein